MGIAKRGGAGWKIGRLADRSGGWFATAGPWVGWSEASNHATGNRGDLGLRAVPSGGKSHDIGLLPK